MFPLSPAAMWPMLSPTSACGGIALEHPETLLKSALEKVVFFECRLDQLNSDLGRAREEIDRLKVDLTQASQREVALRQELAAAEVRSGQASRERDDALEQAQGAPAQPHRFL